MIPVPRMPKTRYSHPPPSSALCCRTRRFVGLQFSFAAVFVDSSVYSFPCSMCQTGLHSGGSSVPQKLPVHGSKAKHLRENIVQVHRALAVFRVHVLRVLRLLTLRRGICCGCFRTRGIPGFVTVDTPVYFKDFGVPYCGYCEHRQHLVRCYCEHSQKESSATNTLNMTSSMKHASTICAPSAHRVDHFMPMAMQKTFTDCPATGS